jgi:hypothetical protein
MGIFFGILTPPFYSALDDCYHSITIITNYRVLIFVNYDISTPVYNNDVKIDPDETQATPPETEEHGDSPGGWLKTLAHLIALAYLRQTVATSDRTSGSDKNNRTEGHQVEDLS